MFLRRWRRNSTFKLITRASLLLLFLFNSVQLLLIKSAQRISLETPQTYNLMSHRPTRLFIAGIHWNNEKVLRERWNAAVVEVVQYFGPENVYVSIYESGSWDDSKGALGELDGKLADLGVERTLILDPETHQDSISHPPPNDVEGDGWIVTPRGKNELRRIPYLAKLRNRVMEPLHKLASPSESSESAQFFDTVLFLNDVYFSLDQLLTLLSTNNGNYAAACSLDFSKPPLYYDTFALRDDNGDKAVTQKWPYFRSARSRAKLLENSDSVPVKSCWNGIIAFSAQPFYNKPEPLAFRGVDDDLATLHVEGSECCLIHTDNPDRDKGVYLNPRVRVGYNLDAWLAVKDENWLSSGQILLGLWRNFLLRWTTTDWFSKMIVKRRVKEYTARTGRTEPGLHCLINEMQVLVWNGWGHV